MIRVGRVIVPVVTLDIFSLLFARLLTVFGSGPDSLQICNEILGTLIIVTLFIVISCFGYWFSDRWVALERRNYWAIMASSSMVTGLLSSYLLPPVMGFLQISGMLHLILLLFGFFILLTLAATSLLRLILGSHSEVSSLNDTTFYRGKSLLFVRGKKNVAICVLRIVGHSTSLSGSNGKSRSLHQSQAEDLSVSKDSFTTYSHLVSLWSNVPDFGVEFMVESALASVKFFTSATDTNAEAAIRSAEQKAEKLKSVLQTRFRTKIEFLQGRALWLAYGSILGSDPCYSHKALKDCLRTTGGEKPEEHYVAVSALKGEVEPTLMVDVPQTRAEQFVSVFSKERLAASMVIRLEAVNPPSVSTETKLIEKARNKPDMRVLLELTEKKSEANEERHAQLSGFWKISAYVVYRGRSTEETKLSQEKGDACLEAIYSSPRSRVKCVKLRGRDIAAQLKNILFRRCTGIIMMKASSMLAATLLNLPEYNVPGIPESTVPAFEVPPREELEDGEIAVGIVMSGDNDICPMRISLKDLMLHTVIFGETGFGKTRLIMKLLEAVSNYDVAWTIIEMKGEYRPLVKALDKVIYLTPASDIAPLRICLFDPQMENPETHAKKIFTILKETFSTLFADQNRDLSAQMERVFYEALVTYVKSTAEKSTISKEYHMENHSDSDRRVGTSTSARSWQGFNMWLRTYAERCSSSSLPQINSTIQALLSRLDSFIRTPLNEVFDNDSSNVNFNDLVKRRAIIDLSEVRAKGTAEDLRLISNIITKYVATAAQQRGIQQELKHILVIDDALDIVPEILAKKTTAETTITEQMVLLLRTTGEGVIISTQRPNISQNIVANAATKIFLRTTVDNEKAAKWLNLNEEQASYLKTIPKREAILTSPKYSKPIRIKTLQMNLPKADERDIVLNNMINYPIVYDGSSKANELDYSIREIAEKRDSLTKVAGHPEIVKLKNMAQNAFNSGNYKGALGIYVRTFQNMEEIPKVRRAEVKNGSVAKSSVQAIHLGNPQLLSKEPPHAGPSAPPKQDRTCQTSENSAQEMGIDNLLCEATGTPSPTLEDKPTWAKVKRAFKHQQEIVQETTLQSRLNAHTLQELGEIVEPIIRVNLIGEIKAPDYANQENFTRLYYQVTDHEPRNILQEYVMSVIQKDLQRKGINTRWIDDNMELLTTIDNKQVITSWTNNSIDPTTVIAKLAKIKHELRYEQTGQLVIITPMTEEATKLQKLFTSLGLPGILTIPFNENETNKLVCQITEGNIPKR